MHFGPLWVSGFLNSNYSENGSSYVSLVRIWKSYLIKYLQIAQKEHDRIEAQKEALGKKGLEKAGETLKAAITKNTVCFRITFSF